MTSKISGKVEICFGHETCWKLPPQTVQPKRAVEHKPAELLALQTAVSDALESPVEFPAFDQAVTPGDLVVLAVDPLVPCVEEVVSHLVQWFCEHGTLPKNLRVLLTANAARASEAIQIRLQKQQPEVEVFTHDVDNTEELAYVAATESAAPIYLNRTMVDADVVIPVVCAGEASSCFQFDDLGLLTELSSRETFGDYQYFPGLSGEQSEARRAWVKEAAWWLGILGVVHVVPAATGKPAAIVAGLGTAALETAQEQLAALWPTSEETESTSQLVVAAVSGAHQNWAMVARALYAASSRVKPNGSIVLCSDFDLKPSKSLKRLRNSSRTKEETLKRIEKDGDFDSLFASLIASVSDDCHIYLTSSLEREVVEGFGLGVIRDSSELLRLIEASGDWTLLPSAQHMPLGLVTS